MAYPPSADRFHAMWERQAGRSVLTMPRADWDRMVQGAPGPVPVDVAATPLGRVRSDASLLATVAYQRSDNWGEVEIYRHDEKDQPTPVNVDKYAVLSNLGSHPRIPQLIREASTEDNPNFRRYLDENVFLVAKNKGPGHWLTGVPTTVRAVVSSNTHD